MNKLLIIFVFLCFSNLFAQSDTVEIEALNDTLFINNNDSSYVNIVSYPHQSWWARNEGAIVGSFIAAFLAGIIAIISVYLTARSIKKQRGEREKEIYCGLLYSIKIELIYHSKNHKNLIEELEVIKHNSLLANEIITDSPSRNISLTFLKEVRNKLIDTELFNTNILLFLSAYVNKCELVNSDINFERMIKVSEKFKDQLNFAESTKSYFDVVIKQLQDLQKSIPEIIEHINADLQLFGETSEINESEYLKIDG